MPALIRRCDHRNRLVITKKTEVFSLTYLNLIQLSRCEKYQAAVDEFATVYVVLSGYCDIEVDGGSLLNIGSGETESHRRIFHSLGHNAAGRAGNLLVSELYCEEGCWSGHPPHKHVEEPGSEETVFEEVYHYRFHQETGFWV
jgi:5-deoxy-D-glucuronate isomerase